MKIAAAQISCLSGDCKANLRKVREFSTRAKESGSGMVLFPEMTDTGYSMPAIRKHATTWNEGAVPELQKMARELSLAIVCGVSERDGSKIYNAQVFVDASGDIVAKYRKTHLVTAAPLDERVCFSPGNEFASCRIGGGLHVGLAICYDLRFPEMCRTLAVKHGVNTFTVSSAWPSVRAEHLRVLATARAMENQSYVVVANRVGTDDDVTLCGGSMIVDPGGATIAAASADREQLIEAEITDAKINDVRKRMLVFEHRRPELYQL
jgi:omega-amidase